MMIISRILLYCLISMQCCATVSDMWNHFKSPDNLTNYCILGALFTGFTTYTLYKKYTTNQWWWQHSAKQFPIPYSENNIQFVFPSIDNNSYSFEQYRVSSQQGNECGYHMLLNSLIVMKKFLPKDNQIFLDQYINYYKITNPEEIPSIPVKTLLEDDELPTHFFQRSEDTTKLIPWREQAIKNYQIIAQRYNDHYKDITYGGDYIKNYTAAMQMLSNTLNNATMLNGSAVTFLLDSIVQKIDGLSRVVRFFITAPYSLKDHIDLPNKADEYLAKTIDDFKDSLFQGKVGVALVNTPTIKGGLHWVSLVIKKEDDKFIIIGTDSVNKSMLEAYSYVQEFIKQLCTY